MTLHWETIPVLRGLWINHRTLIGSYSFVCGLVMDMPLAWKLFTWSHYRKYWFLLGKGDFQPRVAECAPIIMSSLCGKRTNPLTVLWHAMRIPPVEECCLLTGNVLCLWSQTWSLVVMGVWLFSWTQDRHWGVLNHGFNFINSLATIISIFMAHISC